MASAITFPPNPRYAAVWALDGVLLRGVSCARASRWRRACTAVPMPRVCAVFSGALGPLFPASLRANSGAPFSPSRADMADESSSKKRTFRKFSYRGVDLDQLLELKSEDVRTGLFFSWSRRGGVLCIGLTRRRGPPAFCAAQLIQLVHCRARRRFNRGLKRKPMALIKRLRKAKKECQPMVRATAAGGFSPSVAAR